MMMIMMTPTTTTTMESHFCANCRLNICDAANDKWNMLKLNLWTKLYCGIGGCCFTSWASTTHQPPSPLAATKNVLFSLQSLLRIAAPKTNARMMQCWNDGRWSTAHEADASLLILHDQHFNAAHVLCLRNTTFRHTKIEQMAEVASNRNCWIFKACVTRRFISNIQYLPCCVRCEFCAVWSGTAACCSQ